MLQLAVPVAAVLAEQDCAEDPLPSVNVKARPEIAVTPSSFSAEEKVEDNAFASNVGLLAVNVVAVSSLVTTKEPEAELATNVESPANVVVNVYVPAIWFGVIEQLAVPVASVTPEHVGASDPEPSVKVRVLPGTGAPPVVVSFACTVAASWKSEVVALAAVKASVVGCWTNWSTVSTSALAADGWTSPISTRLFTKLLVS